QADGGTLFLDEVGELSEMVQAKLLRTLEERTVERVGGTTPVPVDIRLVAATNRDLEHGIEAGRFREDLFYRLNVVRLELTPLSERRGDIELLVPVLVESLSARLGTPTKTISDEAMDRLKAYSWPGNVRELENEMHRALALAEPGTLILPGLLSDWVRDIIEPIAQSVRSGETLRENMNRIEAWLIRRSLEAHDGRRAETARQLGVTREGLYKKMKRLNIA
ncbi:MAG: sigma-54-dependent Fis family transcriptional regulator, partial [Gammaproteobacteria bacterium]|nr:sigma-54-dependent Fis family transcriptional regulator [Gammaproteobacteria bacterium]